MKKFLDARLVFCKQPHKQPTASDQTMPSRTNKQSFSFAMKFANIANGPFFIWLVQQS